ncbi:PREDICTED: F-box/LRR-repeat protein 21-like [Priapulus caudatus]|uniref:F-box/LRR-repeat protein 21-like n=1 Tax=Priapulus caudatus TaxID=37621 RepID=A0ABM1E2R2_PRICU|nr:PREDICTED: F-box/LRR-repeat protein 21-like [Priapulus caudatus]
MYSSFQRSYVRHGYQRNSIHRNTQYRKSIIEILRWTMPDWETLPNLALVRIFSYLSTVDKLAVSSVCQQWIEAANHPLLWRRADITSTLCEQDRRDLVQSYSAHIRHVNISGLTSSELRSFVEVLRDGAAVGLCLESLSIDFPVAEQRGADADLIPELRQLFAVVTTLRRFSVRNTRIACAFYMLSPDPMAEVLQNCAEGLHTFELINYTLLKFSKPLAHIGACRHLVRLVVSPQHLGETVLLSLVTVATLRAITIICNRYTSRQNCHIIPSSRWTEFAVRAPKVRVEFYAHSLAAFAHLLMDAMPLSLVYFEDVLTFDCIRNVKQYSDSLETFAFVNGFNDVDKPSTNRTRTPTHGGANRNAAVAANGVVLRRHVVAPPPALSPTTSSPVFDSHMITFVSACKRLHTFVFSEAISCSVLLLMVDLCPRLRVVRVRRACLVLDGQRSNVFKETTLSQRSLWFKSYASHLPDFEKQMSLMLRYPWQPLSDADFVMLCKRL